MFNKKHVLDSIQFTPVADSMNADIRILAILSGAMAAVACILLGKAYFYNQEFST